MYGRSIHSVNLNGKNKMKIDSATVLYRHGHRQADNKGKLQVTASLCVVAISWLPHEHRKHINARHHCINRAKRYEVAGRIFLTNVKCHLVILLQHFLRIPIHSID